MAGRKQKGTGQERKEQEIAVIYTQEVYDALYETDKFIILVTGGRGSAKSFNVSTFVKRLSYEAGHVILYSRYTMSSASMSVIPEFIEKIELEDCDENFKITKNEIINLESGSEIKFRGIKTSSGNQTAKLKSIKGLTTFVGDEMEEWQSEEDYDTLMLSIRQKNMQNRVILVLNPTDAEHFIYKKYIENTHKIVYYDGVPVQISTHPSVCHIHTTYIDNIENLSTQFLEEVAMIKKDQPVKYEYKIIGRWADVREGAIFENWEEGVFDENLPYAFGQDYGFKIDPDTLVKVAIDKKLKRLYVDERFYAIGKSNSTDTLFEMNKTHIDKPNDLIVADCAEARLINDLNIKGLNIIECEKGAGSVSAGITAMLGYKIIVTPRSHKIKKELKNYVWNDKKAGIPIDDYNHTIDAIRYAFRFLLGDDFSKANKQDLGFY
ncbi:MAG: phage terminase large subunit [Pedobacter sp.]|nr:phage terminase large subunit [Pedobacter sp.]